MYHHRFALASRPNVSLCSLNIRSLSNTDHIIALHDLANSHKFDCFAISETWLSSTNTPSEVLSIPPPGYDMLAANRDSRLAGAKGGGVAFLYRRTSKLLSSDVLDFSSFEAISATLGFDNEALHVVCVYRPPITSSYAKPFSVFIDEFSTLLASLTASKSDFVIVGDLNIHLDIACDLQTQQFLNLLSSCNVVQHVNVPTHSGNHILDVVITPTTSALVTSSVDILPFSPSDHYPVVCSFNICANHEKPDPTMRSFRRINAINSDNFCADICNSKLNLPTTENMDELVEMYNSTLSELLNKHAPLITKSVRHSNPWYTADLRKQKAACRKAERLWRKTHSSVWKAVANLEHKMYRAAIGNAKRQYYSSLINDAANSKTLWKTVNGLLHRTSISTYPSQPVESLPNQFATYFSEKVSNLRASITNPTGTTSASAHFLNPAGSKFSLSDFAPTTVEEVTGLILNSKGKYCLLDPVYLLHL